VRDLPQKVKVEDVKMKLWCRPASKSGRCDNNTFVRDLPQFLKVEVVKMTLELSVPQRVRSENDPRTPGTVSHPSAGQASPSIFRDTCCPAKHTIISCIRYLSKTHFVRDFPQIPTVEDVRTKQYEAFMRDSPKLKITKMEDMKTKLSCETSLKKVKVEDVKTELWCETSFCFVIFLL